MKMPRLGRRLRFACDVAVDLSNTNYEAFANLISRRLHFQASSIEFLIELAYTQSTL